MALASWSRRDQQHGRPPEQILLMVSREACLNFTEKRLLEARAGEQRETISRVPPPPLGRIGSAPLTCRGSD